jgi:hypothetical protein
MADGNCALPERFARSRSTRHVAATGDECEIALEFADGPKVYLPSQYFGVYLPRAHLRPFAAKLAEVLEVPVKEPR